LLEIKNIMSYFAKLANNDKNSVFIVRYRQTDNIVQEDLRLKIFRNWQRLQ